MATRDKWTVNPSPTLSDHDVSSGDHVVLSSAGVLVNGSSWWSTSPINLTKSVNTVEHTKSGAAIPTTYDISDNGATPGTLKVKARSGGGSWTADEGG